MRVTSRMMTDHAVQNMSASLEQLQQLSEKIASQKQFQSVSEDPVAASASLGLRSLLQVNAAYRATATRASDWLQATDAALQQTQTLALRAENLMQRGLNDALGAEERRTSLAAEMQEILNQVVDLSNTQHYGEYLFSGYKTSTLPFTIENGAVTYHGDDNTIRQHIGQEQWTPVSVDGESAFSPLMDALIRAQHALEVNDTGELRQALADIQQDNTGLPAGLAATGARLRQVQVVTATLDKADFEIKSLLSQNEDINLAEAIARFQNQQVAYQTVLEVSQRAISALSLFDYLR